MGLESSISRRELPSYVILLFSVASPLQLDCPSFVLICLFNVYDSDADLWTILISWMPPIFALVQALIGVLGCVSIRLLGSTLTFCATSSLPAFIHPSSR